MKRLFFGYPVSEENGKILIDYFSPLAEGRATLTKRSNLHITQYFIGNVADENVSRIIEISGSVFESKGKATFKFEKYIQKSKMWWALMDHSESPFHILSHELHKSLKHLSSGMFHENALAHITIARFKKHVEPPDFSNFPALHEMHFTECQLYVSENTKQGVQYTSVASFPL